MKKNEILVIYGTEYKELTKQLLEEADLAGMIGDRKKRIAVKPNLVSAAPASVGGTTHTEVIAGILEYLQDRGYEKIKIMEGSWVGDRTQEAFRVCGYRKLASDYGVELIDCQKEPGVPVDAAGMKIQICKCVQDVDFLINVPVMKGHCQTRMTCALKNMKGLITNKEKRRFHSEGLHRPIAHLNKAIHQDFILVDGICGDLTFEEGGNPTQMDRLMAAADPVLLDAYVCGLMDYRPDDVPYIRLAEKLGVGCADVRKAVIRELDAPLHEAILPDRERIMRLSDLAEEVDSCSACYGYLLPALDMLDKDGLLKDFPEKICIGQGWRGKSGELGIGNCTSKFCHSLKGCPPTEQEMYEFLKQYIRERK